MSYLDGWSPELLKHRAETIQGYLADKNLQALAVTDPLNLTYVTGFFLDIAPWERPVVAVIPVDGSPFMILCELSTNHLRFSLEQGRGLITDIRFYTEHYSFDGSIHWLVLLCRNDLSSLEASAFNVF